MTTYDITYRRKAVECVVILNITGGYEKQLIQNGIFFVKTKRIECEVEVLLEIG